MNGKTSRERGGEGGGGAPKTKQTGRTEEDTLHTSGNGKREGDGGEKDTKKTKKKEEGRENGTPRKWRERKGGETRKDTQRNSQIKTARRERIVGDEKQTQATPREWREKETEEGGEFQDSTREKQGEDAQDTSATRTGGFACLRRSKLSHNLPASAVPGEPTRAPVPVSNKSEGNKQTRKTERKNTSRAVLVPLH